LEEENKVLFAKVLSPPASLGEALRARLAVIHHH
jgi:hypothetical protein